MLGHRMWRPGGSGHRRRWQSEAPHVKQNALTAAHPVLLGSVLPYKKAAIASRLSALQPHTTLLRQQSNSYALQGTLKPQRGWGSPCPHTTDVAGTDADFSPYFSPRLSRVMKSRRLPRGSARPWLSSPSDSGRCPLVPCGGQLLPAGAEVECEPCPWVHSRPGPHPCLRRPSRAWGRGLSTSASAGPASGFWPITPQPQASCPRTPTLSAQATAPFTVVTLAF